jgi:hypothetical protein
MKEAKPYDRQETHEEAAEAAAAPHRPAGARGPVVGSPPVDDRELQARPRRCQQLPNPDDAEEEPVTTLTKAKSSRAEALSQNLSKLLATRYRLESRLAAIPDLEDAARFASLEGAPGERSDGSGSEARKLQAEFVRRTSDLDQVNREISTVERALRDARLQQMEMELAATSREADTLAHAEEALSEAAGEQLAALAATYAQLRDECWEPRERRREALRHGVLANLLNAPEAEETFQEAWRARVRPLPATFHDFVSFAVEVMCGPYTYGYRHEGGRRLDAESRLTALLPDLRGDQLRPVELLRTERWTPPGRAGLL